MKTKEEIGDLLESVLGNNRVYFQAPPNTGMKYPCMVYRFVRPDVDYADNKPYMITGRWEVHHMYKSPEKELVADMLFATPYVTHDNRIVKDGIYNDYYTINQ